MFMRQIMQISSILLTCGFMFAIVIIYRKRNKIFSRTHIKTNEKSVLEQKQDLDRQFNALTSDQWYEVGQVETLYIYPILSGKMRKIPHCNFRSKGMSIKHACQQELRDKMFVVYNEKTKRVETQYLSLSMIKIKSIRKYKLKLQAIGIENLIIDNRDVWNENRKVIECTIWYNNTLAATIKCIDCGEKAANWLSKLFIGTTSGFRLGYSIEVPHLKEEIYVAREKREPDTIMGPFSDPTCYTLMSSRSLDELNLKTEMYISNEQLHPHIIITPICPFIEDNWEWLRIGNAFFRNVKSASRTYKETDLMQIPVGLRLKLAVINCELYIPGHVANGDKVYAYNFA